MQPGLTVAKLWPTSIAEIRHNRCVCEFCTLYWSVLALTRGWSCPAGNVGWRNVMSQDRRWGHSPGGSQVDRHSHGQRHGQEGGEAQGHIGQLTGGIRARGELTVWTQVLIAMYSSVTQKVQVQTTNAQCFSATATKVFAAWLLRCIRPRRRNTGRSVCRRNFPGGATLKPALEETKAGACLTSTHPSEFHKLACLCGD